MAAGTIGTGLRMPLETSAAETEIAAGPGARDVVTIVAISVIAFAIGNLVHEGAGHGGACWLSGGHAKLLTTVNFDCSIDSRFISAGGTLANFLAGFLAWIALRASQRAPGQVRFFCWLFMTINLMTATGYFFFSGVANIGDWSDVVRGFQPVWAWRVALTVLGIASYSLVVWFALRELRPLLPARDLRRGGAKKLTIVPYLTGGVLYTIAGLLNPVGMILVAISAAAASFGGTSGLAWMTQYLHARPGDDSRAGILLPRSPAWITAACIIAMLFIVVLGRGVAF